LTLDRFEPVDMAFDRAVAPRQAERFMHGLILS
jgi:hypothetical protein